MQDITKLYKKVPAHAKPKNTYVVHITCDANDGDYVYNDLKLSEEDFNDPLFLYVLAYVAKGDRGKFGDNETGDSYMYGEMLENNWHFDWLHDYCCEADLLAFCGAIDDYCHSIEEISITYYDEDGKEWDIEIPDFDDLFDTVADMQMVMNDLKAKRDAEMAKLNNVARLIY